MVSRKSYRICAPRDYRGHISNSAYCPTPVAMVWSGKAVLSFSSYTGHRGHICSRFVWYRPIDDFIHFCEQFIKWPRRAATQFAFRPERRTYVTNSAAGINVVCSQNVPMRQGENGRQEC